jgi:lysophospholipid acyltransferase (LPLAT)-like uncharacterized protein
MSAFGGKHDCTVALTSRHRDGSFVASILRGVGVKSVRGSSGKGGKRAALELLKLANDNDIVITPDGPRGPRRAMSRGIVYIASKSGNAIIPTGFACSNPWEIQGSWTTLTIPKPFSRVILLAGEPIPVPANITETETDSYVQAVQRAMDQLHDLANSEVCRATVRPLETISPSFLDKAA